MGNLFGIDKRNGERERERERERRTFFQSSTFAFVSFPLALYRNLKNAADLSSDKNFRSYVIPVTKPFLSH
jgi:hypothetical protein